jgi:hypothetical protein
MPYVRFFLSIFFLCFCFGNSAWSDDLISKDCPAEFSEGTQDCPPADWILCPEYEGVELWTVNMHGITEGSHVGADWIRPELDMETVGVWYICNYGVGPRHLKKTLGPEKFSQVLQIEGRVVQVGGPDDETRGLRILRGSLKREPLSRRVEDPTKDTDLAGVYLGWSEEELRAFADREGYQWQEGSFADYVTENWGLSFSPPQESRRVVLVRADGVVNVLLSPETQRVREVLLHLTGNDAVRAHWRAAMLRFGPDRNYRGRSSWLEHYWGSDSGGVVVQFQPKENGWQMDSEEAYMRLFYLIQ